jgi:hypothetical protein
MRGSRLAALTLALGSCALTQPFCYSQKADEKKGQSLPIETNVGSQGYSCGFASSPLYCYGIPVNVNGQPGGSFWVDTYLTGANAGTGFIVWTNVADLAEANISSNSYTNGTFTSNGLTITAPASMTAIFSGDTNDGDGGSYTGTMTLDFTYYYSSGGGGIGGGGAGWRFTCIGGTISIKYAK